MEAEQSAPDSEASIHQRFVAAYTPEAAQQSQAEPEGEEPASLPSSEDGGEQEAEQAESVTDAAGDEFEDFEADDGKILKVSKELKPYVTRTQDYTRKTQAAANLAEVSQDRLHFAEVREQYNNAFTQKGAEVQALELQLKQLDGINVYELDQQTAWRIRDQRDELRRQVNEGKQMLSAWQNQLGEVAKQHAEKQWGLAVQGAKAAIGQFTPGEDAAMLKQVSTLGFTEKEIKGRFADPRVLLAIYKAAKWDTLQAGKGKAVETAKTAPPVLKPGVSKGPGAAAEQKYRDARQQLKKTGSVDAAARLFLMRG